MRSKFRPLAWIAFGAYCALMLWLLFGQRMGIDSSRPYPEQLIGNLNLIPFRTILEYAHMVLADADGHAFINLAGNVVMFVPLGFFLPLLWPGLRPLKRFLLCSMAIILSIETIQLFTFLGSCDIDDLILNVLGAAIGFLLFQLVYRKKEKDGI